MVSMSQRTEVRDTQVIETLEPYSKTLYGLFGLVAILTLAIGAVELAT